MRKAAKERKATMKYGQGDVTKTSKNNNASKAWIPSANVLPLQEPRGKLLKTMARQQRLSMIEYIEFYVERCTTFS